MVVCVADGIVLVMGVADGVVGGAPGDGWGRGGGPW